MGTIKVVLEDTGEEMEIDMSDNITLQNQYNDNILASNTIEGRDRTTYWRYPEKMEEYRLKKISEVSNG